MQVLYATFFHFPHKNSSDGKIRRRFWYKIKVQEIISCRGVEWNSTKKVAHYKQTQFALLPAVFKPYNKK